MKNIHIHAFISIKGGVGKSALSVLCGHLLAQRGRRCVVIDADMTGTSLADGLQLCAPKANLLASGGVDLTIPPRGEEYWSSKETDELRDRRRDSRWKHQPPPPPYLNDALTFTREEGAPDCRIDAMLWRPDRDRDTGIYFLPSSPLPQDLALAMDWLYEQEHWDFGIRLAWILIAICQQRSDLTDIVIDLPPTFLGFTQATLGMLKVLEGVSGTAPAHGFPKPADYGLQFHAHPFLVTTIDRNALLPSVEVLADAVSNFRNFVLLLNRGGRPEIEDFLIKRFGQQVEALELNKKLEVIDEYPLILGRIFRDRKLSITAEIEKASRAFRI